MAPAQLTAFFLNLCLVIRWDGKANCATFLFVIGMILSSLTEATVSMKPDRYQIAAYCLGTERHAWVNNLAAVITFISSTAWSR